VLLSAWLLILQEQLNPVLIAVLILSSAVVLLSASWRPALRISFAAQVIVLLAYTWSLGDTLHVVVQSTHQGYLAIVGNNSGPLNVSNHRHGRVGLYTGAADTYDVQASGAYGAPIVSNLLTDFDSLMRFISPGPAWTHITLALHHRHRGPTILNIGRLIETKGTWAVNPRGELQGSPGSAGFLPVTPHGTFVLSADLMRPDGLQGVLVGVGSHDRGYIMAIRMDRRFAWWLYWNHGPRSPQGHGTATFQVATDEMAKRLLRYSLPSELVALVLIAMAIAVYRLLGFLASAVAELLPSTGKPDFRLRVKFSDRWPDFAGVAIGVIAIVPMSLIAQVLYHGLPNVQDAVAYLFQAQTMALGRLWAPVPRLPSFFYQLFVVIEHGHRFGKYPPGWPALLTLGVLAHVPWLIGPVVAGAGIVVLYLIARLAYGWKLALGAALLAGTSPFLLFVGASFYPHATVWLFAGSAILLLLQWERTQPHDRDRVRFRLSGEGWKYLTGAGLIFGAAVMTRQLDAIVLCLPFLLVLWKRPLSVVWIGIGGIVPAIVYFAYNQVLTGSILGNAYVIGRPYDRLGFGRTVGGPGHYESNYNFARALWNIVYDLQHLQIGLFGWPFYVTLAIAAVPFLLARATRWDWLFAASSLSVVIAYIFYFADGVWYTYPRYWYVIIPWLCLLTMRGFQELYRLPLRVRLEGEPRPVAAALLPAGLAVVLAINSMVNYVPGTISLLTRFDSGATVAIDTAARHHLHDALVFQVQPSRQAWWPYGGVFNQNSPLLDGNIIWARDERNRDRRLMRLYPHRRYYRLNGTQLIPLRPNGSAILHNLGIGNVRAVATG